ncbi:MAG: hypothetical protein EPN38_04980 [Rhodanobacteraceae bacterium]|nr:MAG: hypothetical protein EPN38_04980 [Rhodanobacteraceae bacterium]
MRVQFQAQSLRLRIDEAELARLLDGEMLVNTTCWPDGSTTQQRLAVSKANGWRRDGSGWCVMLAEASVRALASRLPSRDGLHTELPVPDGAPLEVLFDIDVRDSTHRRFPEKPANRGGPST